MDSTTLAYEQLIAKFTIWAQGHSDIRAAAVIGSRARQDHPADEWSDLDIVIFATDPQRYLTSHDWLKNMGEVWITFLEPTAIGDDMECRVLYEGGLDVDFAIIPCVKIERMIQEGLPPDVISVLRRGVRELLDRDGVLAQMRSLCRDPELSGPVTQSKFLETVNDFWYHAVWTAKKLRRGELWIAKACCDGHMKRLLREVIEWHTQALNDWHTDTWHGGRFMERWADPRALEGLRSAFAHYDEDDIRRALRSTMELFRGLAKETAEKTGYAYPTFADERATELVNSLLY